MKRKSVATIASVYNLVQICTEREAIDSTAWLQSTTLNLRSRELLNFISFLNVWWMDS